MLIIEKIFTSLTSKQVGTDQFGNKYYESHFRKNYLNQKARYVMYKGKVESSKVPPMWHAWLHYLMKDVPTNNALSHKWEKDFMPNVTGTKFAYTPALKKVSNNYTSWKPGVAK
jgi:NADH:ubiquinone oxidoreductase subunit